MVDHIATRASVIEALFAELLGPDPRGPELDFSVDVDFATAKDSYGPRRQAATGEEVLQGDAPTKRYGIGVLYVSEDVAPLELEPTDAAPLTPELSEEGPDLLSLKARKRLEADAERIAAAAAAESADDDFDLSGANDYRPNTVAVSFLLDLSNIEAIAVTIAGGRYIPKSISIAQTPRAMPWWLRTAVHGVARFSAESLRSDEARSIMPSAFELENAGKLSIDIFCVVRPQEGEHALVTVGAVNRSTNVGADEGSLFQTHLTVEAITKTGIGAILPYPDAGIIASDDEEQSLELLYRDYQTFGIGHGCAADWHRPDSTHRVSRITGEPLPKFETPSITAEVARKDGTPLTILMAPLAGLMQEDDGEHSLQDVVDGYREWISERERETGGLPPNLRAAAKRHTDECRTMLDRMQSGLQYLRNDAIAARAFRLANHAVLLQQIRAGSRLRTIEFDAKAHRVRFSAPYVEPDALAPPTGRGKWRPFQIAFLLASIQSTGDERHQDREVVDLIFFPTGGGKTEAYLGLSAFSIFSRRLRNPADCGTQILMRYTLRLLTAQQFQRAAALICAMELLRLEDPDALGRESFRIGIWVGGDTTPNRIDDAKQILRDLRKGDKWAENKFVVIRCPWCSAEIGPIKYPGKPPKNAPRVVGYDSGVDGITIRCSDDNCAFANGLPVVVVDDQIYETRPDLVIGTVDKFARLAWDSRARRIFGLGDDGAPLCSPPSLIIQDELHLISGPLGSMVGLYEAVIEDLCTKRIGHETFKPKIVSSTATIRRFEQQVEALFGRSETALFPPRGLDIEDSFFAQYARDETGALLPGRIYVGVHGPGLGSMQTAQVRTFSALLQAPATLHDKAARDPWWTLLAFFNSLRELGTTLTLLQSDIQNYLKTMKMRMGIDWPQVRRLNEPLELTGRLRSEEVPEAIRALELTTTDEGYPVDVCLASNIIEVGVDIDRLSLLTVVGQPKTTAQYIQVSGRVGRRWWERPGLVVTIYGASKPRDRSHFEKFRSYHERLYAQVEPTSVTPFSPPVLDRAAHAVLIAYVRQRGQISDVASPYPPPHALLAAASSILEERLELVDKEERAELKRVLALRLREWEHWGKTAWVRGEGDSFLMREYAGYVEARYRRTTWQVPSSLRNVDAGCEAIITSLYSIEAAEAAAGDNHGSS